MIKLNNITCKKIVTHVEPRHFDEFFAIAFAKFFLGDSVAVEYVNSLQNLTNYTRDKEIMLIDVGKQYNPSKLNFDHHQNKDFPCSLNLVLNFFEKECAKQGSKVITNAIKMLLNSSLVNYVDIVDRYGRINFTRLEQFILKESVLFKGQVILNVDLDLYGSKIAERLMYLSFFLVKKDDTVENWINSLYSYLEQEGALNTAFNRIEEQLKFLEEKLKESCIIEKDLIKIIVSRNSITPHHKKIFSETNADFLIEKNVLNSDYTTIVKNSDKKHLEKLEIKNLFMLESGTPVITENNDILVLDVSVEKFDYYWFVSRVNDLIKKNKKFYNIFLDTNL